MINLTEPIINQYSFESVENGRLLTDIEFELVPLVTSKELKDTVKLTIYIDGVSSKYEGTVEELANIKLKTNAANRTRFKIKSNKFNWIVRAIPVKLQHDKIEPVVTIEIQFQANTLKDFILPSLTRHNPYLYKYDSGNFIATYHPDATDHINLCPLILMFGRIKNIPDNIFDNVYQDRENPIDITLYNSLAGTHIKRKWNIEIFKPLVQIARVYGKELKGLGSWTMRSVNTENEDPVIDLYTFWLNDGIQGDDAICGDLYALLYDTDTISNTKVLNSLNKRGTLYNELKSAILSKDKSSIKRIRDKCISPPRDYIIPLLFANCGNENGYTVDENLFKNYYKWCLNRSLSDPKILLVGTFAGSFITKVVPFLNTADINTKIQYSNIANMPIWSASEYSKGHIHWDDRINSMTRHKDLLNENITKRPHMVFMGYLPNDFTYAWCPILVVNKDAITESFRSSRPINPEDKENLHFVNYRGQFMNCLIDTKLDLESIVNTYESGRTLYIAQLAFAQYISKKNFISMIVRIDSSLNSKTIQAYSRKVIDLVRYIRVSYTKRTSFRFKWPQASHNNRFILYADYLLYNRQGLTYIETNDNNYENPYSSYRRAFASCRNLEKIPSDLIPMEFILKDFKPSILAFIEMFNGCNTYVPIKLFKNPNKISSGYVLNLNVTNMLRDDYFVVEFDPITKQPKEDLNGIDIRAFGHIAEVSPSITEEQIRKWKNIPDHLIIVFKEYQAHPEAKDDRWVPYFYCKIVTYSIIGSKLNR